jgi:lipid A ethanolaminephosphotransferase
VIERVKDRNALVIYTSDHAESLGEGGRFLHGHEDAPEDYAVPMMWWASDSFIARHEAAWKKLESHAKDTASHDVIFHSLLDCAGISSSVIDPSLSLCAPAK